MVQFLSLNRKQPLYDLTSKDVERSRFSVPNIPKFRLKERFCCEILVYEGDIQETGLFVVGQIKDHCWNLLREMISRSYYYSPYWTIVLLFSFAWLIT